MSLYWKKRQMIWLQEKSFTIVKKWVLEIISGILSDIESLIVYAGVHQRYYDSYRMFSKRSPYAIYYEIQATLVYVTTVLPLRVEPTKTEAKMQKRH